MKRIAVYVLVLVSSLILFNCSEVESSKSLAEFDIDRMPLQQLELVDSSFLNRYILANDVITQWPAVKKLNAQLNIQTGKEKHLEEYRKIYQFYKYSTVECNGLRHELILRRMTSEMDVIPDQTLLLLVIDKQGYLLSTVTLAAKSAKQLITQLDQETTSVLHQDSTLTTVQYSDFCSDVMDEQGNMPCTKVEIKTSYKISCDKVIFLASDTVKTKY